MVAEILDSLKIDNELTADELNLLDNLNLESFDKDKNIDNMTEMQTALKATTIEIAWEEEKLTLYNIATKFDEYVEQWEWWKLQIKDWLSNTPSWITNIIENPKNNDLAYLIQKVAWLISYKTARQYTEKQLDAVEVTIDKTFGNQTRRALSWLKKWIENDQDYEDINAWQEYAMKYIGKQFIDWLISDKVDNKTKNDALSKYHLQYNNGEILPADWYKFIDLNSSNYAVEKEQNEDVESEASTILNESSNQDEPVETGLFEQDHIATDILNELKYNSSDYSLEISYDPENLKLIKNNTNDKFEVEIKIQDLLDNGKLKADAMNMITNYEKQLDEMELANKIAIQIRWKDFKKTEIYPDYKELSGRSKKKVDQYFKLFPGGTLSIDTDPNWVEMVDINKIRLRIAKKYQRIQAFHWNVNTNEHLKFPVSNITDAKGNLDKDKLKKQLRKISDRAIDLAWF